jgi:hypothetical protein
VHFAAAHNGQKPGMVGEANGAAYALISRRGAVLHHCETLIICCPLRRFASAPGDQLRNAAAKAKSCP